MTGKQSRRWRSWEDYMREWCARTISATRYPIFFAEKIRTS